MHAWASPSLHPHVVTDPRTLRDPYLTRALVALVLVHVSDAGRFEPDHRRRHVQNLRKTHTQT